VVGLIDGFLLSHHLYADDTRLLKRTQIDDIGSPIYRLQQSIVAIHGRRSKLHSDVCMQSNPPTTDAIWFGTKASLSSLKTMKIIDLTLHVDRRDLCVILDY